MDPKIWDNFTRKEEYGSPIRDQYNRFPYYASSCRHIFEPCVSKYLIEKGYHVEYPEGKTFAICLTHDIDSIYTSVFTKAVSAMRHLHQGSLLKFIRSMAQLRSKKLPNWNFDDILALEEKYGARSSFYFMAENLGELDYAYRIEDCNSLLGEIVDCGCEVGLHGGHTTYCIPEELKSKKERLEKVLNKKVIGYRSHYLRIKIPETWDYLQEAGFLYDSTLGYADCIGFRNGMCHPFKPYNLITQREIDILEIPLTIMDSTLDMYMKLDDSWKWELTKRLIDTVERYHGVLTVLWHNTNFFDEKKEFYETILKYCAEKGAWMTSGEEIAKWLNDGN
jgi:peptidoglycan/xylan/chitin deacetylase (PgdA/CDA1 family)